MACVTSLFRKGLPLYRGIEITLLNSLSNTRVFDQNKLPCRDPHPLGKLAPQDLLGLTRKWQRNKRICTFQSLFSLPLQTMKTQHNQRNSSCNRPWCLPIHLNNGTENCSITSALAPAMESKAAIADWRQIVQPQAPVIAVPRA